MNAKAIALFAVLAVALTGGFAIVGADAADADDFKAEYMTAGPLEGVQITFDVAPYDKIDWLGTVYGNEGTIVKDMLLKFDGNKTAIAWKAKPLAVGTYQVEIADKDQTTTYKGSFVVPEKFTVTFTAEGTLVKELTVEDGDYIAADQLPEDPEKEGQKFLGWFLDGAAEAFDFATTPITQSLDFIAHFEPIDYTVTVVNQDGKQIGETKTAKFGEKIEFEVIAPTGSALKSVVSRPVIDDFVFDTETGEGSFTMPASNVTLVATIEKIDYTVTVVNQDGKQIGETKTANFGDKVEFEVIEPLGSEAKSAVSSPVIEDFVFSAETCEGSFTMPASDVTVTVTFELIDCTVTFYVDGEAYDKPVTVKYGETLTTVPDAPAKEGYTFTGWYELGALEPFKLETPITGDLDLYADYELNEYTVNVVDQVGNSLDDPQKVYYGMPALFKFPVNLLGAVPTSVTSSVPDVKITYDLELGTGMFTMPASDVTVTVTYTVIPVGGCTVTYVDVYGFTKTESYEIGEPVVYHVTTVPEGMKLDSVDFEPDMDFYIDQEACTVEFTAVEGNYTATISYIAPFTVTILNQDGKKIGDDFQYFAEEPVEIDVGMYLGVEVESATSEPEIDDFNCEDGVITFTMPEQDVTVTVTLKPIVPDTVKVVFIDGITEEEVGTRMVPVGTILKDVPEALIHEDMTFTGWYREGSDVPYEFETMPVMENMTVYAMYEDSPIIDTVTVTFIVDEEVYAKVDVEVGTVIPEDKMPEDPVKEGYDFSGWMSEEGMVDFTEPIEDDMEVIAIFLPHPVAFVVVTFVDGETETEVVVNMGECVVAPEAAGKEGYNFVGWFKEGFEQSFDFETPITEPLTLFAKYVETPQIEGFAVLYHDMYQGEPVDIWWKGYTSKDDRVMLANGMDATPGVVFKGWLAEDQKTLLTWNAAYDLNDIERNDCLIYPAYYGYPGTDGIYELNAIYELHIQWIGFDGETVIDEQDVVRGAFLVPKYSDEDMTAKLEQEMPSDKQYKYSWTGWRIGDSETTYTSEQIGSVKVDGAWKIFATYGKDLNEYDITFNWHDGTSTIQVAYGDTPEIENPPAYEDDNFTYTFAGWDPEVKKVDGDATYTATYDKTSKTKDVTITVNDFAYGYFTYNDEKQTADYILKVPMDAEAPVIDGNVLTFDFVKYESGNEVPETHVFTAFPNPDDTMHYEFVEWTVSEDGNTYTANFVTDIITSTDLDRILTFFDSTKAEDGKVRFTIGSKDGLAIPKGTMTVYYYEMEFNKRLGIYTQVEKHCDPISMDWGEEYGKNLISATIVYDDLKQDGEAFDITTKDISVMWLDFDGVNEAESKSNKATPGQ